jgi:hypothetical protein
MSLIYDFYGSSQPSIDVVEEALTKLLGTEFEARYSDYWGGDYYNAETTGSEIIRIVSNGPEEDADDLPYEGFDEYPVIVEVNASPRADHLRDLLLAAGFVHLRRDVVGHK